MRKKRRLKIGRIICLLLVIILIVGGIYFIFVRKTSEKSDDIYMPELKTLEEANTFADSNNLKLNIKYEYDEEITKDGIISQSVKKLHFFVFAK